MVHDARVVKLAFVTYVPEESQQSSESGFVRSHVCERTSVATRLSDERSHTRSSQSREAETSDRPATANA